MTALARGQFESQGDVSDTLAEMDFEAKY